ncbi:unnamed protein product [Schistosoma mattheei]|uniref:Uncharacterized protein n=1 Tax=Schistosoma mattheei TaxID=31246 RepID=A0A3P8EHB3_9TREM|nr:unnamed protein product [Schistosoma mattheei]
MRIVTWIYLHLKVDFDSRTRIQYSSLQMPSGYSHGYWVLKVTNLCNGVKFKFTWYSLLESLH